MFNLGFSELILLAVIAIVVIGPKKLPAFAREVVRILNDLKHASSEITEAITQVREETKDAILDVKHQLEDEVNQVVEEAQKDIDLNIEPDADQLNLHKHNVATEDSKLNQEKSDSVEEKNNKPEGQS